MAFDFDKINTDDTIIPTGDLEFHFLIKNMFEYVKALQPALTDSDFKYNQKTKVITCSYSALGILYNSLRYKAGISYDILKNVKFNLIYSSNIFYTFAQSTQQWHYLPFIPPTGHLYYTQDIKYNQYNFLAHRYIVEDVLVVPSKKSYKFFLHISYITNYIKYIINNIEPLSFIKEHHSFISFVPYIYNHVKVIFDNHYSTASSLCYTGSPSWGDSIRANDNITKFINYKNNDNLEFYFINPIDDILSFIEYCIKVNAITDALTMLMFVQSIYKAKVYRVQKSAFNHHFKKLKEILLGNNNTLYAGNIFKGFSFSILGDFLKNINVPDFNK